jgi:hypothetical protein
MNCPKCRTAHAGQCTGFQIEQLVAENQRLREMLKDAIALIELLREAIAATKTTTQPR